MKKVAIVKILAILTGITGVVVMLGWIFDIGLLKSILPQWVSMKFSTALSFFLCGLILYFVVSELETESALAKVVLPISTLIVLLFMVTLIASSLLGVYTGIENWFVQESEDEAVKTIVPGRPSIGTMVAFSLVAIGGLLTFVRPKALRRSLLLIGLLVSLLSGLALLGYLFDIPILYYSIDGVSTAMAIHTAILFSFLSAGLMLTGIDGKRITGS